jgi:hypothetical protein
MPTKKRSSLGTAFVARVVTEGAWITAILIPALIITMSAVKRHYGRVAREVAVQRPMCIDNLSEPFVIVPLDRWTRITEKGLRFAMKLSDQVQAVHVDAEGWCDEVEQRSGKPRGCGG